MEELDKETREIIIQAGARYLADEIITPIVQREVDKARKQRDIQWVKFLMREKHFLSDIPPADYGQVEEVSE